MSNGTLPPDGPFTRTSVNEAGVELWDVEVFFDGDCPLCTREMAMLRRRDRHHRIRFTDITDVEFDPESIGRNRIELMAEIHGRLPDGTIMTDVKVFRRLYSAVGFTRLVAITRIRVLSGLLDFGYAEYTRETNVFFPWFPTERGES